MNGILPLWKPAGFTSHDCVMKTRKLLKTKKVGHTGTLDPAVTGVLPLAIGSATRVVQFLQEAGKSYIGEVTIGYSTTTEDAQGDMVESKPITKAITREELLAALEKLTGTIIQTPPMFSAVKVNGRRLYEYAREGKEVERPKREVTIYELQLLDERSIFYDENQNIRFSIRVKCSKGTYIRTLAVMIGELLGYPAHMSSLVRTSAAGIDQSQCLTFDDIEKLIENDQIEENLLPIETVLQELPKFEIHDTLAERVRNGAVLSIPDNLQWVDDTPLAIYINNQIIAIYQKHPDKIGMMKPIRVLS